jgi:hypothetical protein
MLDSHPHLAVPPESHFVVQGPGLTEDVATALERILAHNRFKEWDLAAEQVRREVTRQRIDTYAGLVDCVFGLFAEARGKRRWGDRTPQYVFHVPRLIRLFPNAQFIHVIRDGREVAASIYEHRWAGSVITAADRWRRTVAAGRRWARLGPERYREVRLDRLIESPAQTLGELCTFLGEPYAPQMLEYQRDARSRVPSSERGRADHSSTERPPTPGLRDWTAGLSVRERIAVEAVCARQLSELGMDAPRPPLRGYLVAMNDILRTRAAELLHPEWRPDRLDPSTASIRHPVGTPEAV